MGKVNFAIALHFHQPTGNFESVFKKACELCYRPFFELLFKYPKIKLSVHISGCLLDYLEKAEPGIIKSIKKMACRRQIEIIGGGYYEPIFPAIAERDMIGQIKKMAGYIKKNFKAAPSGAWIPERVWESRLTRPLHKAGVRYCILDDEHLIRSGLDKKDTFGYFMTGKDEERMAVFPSDKSLRYIIPFNDTKDVFDYFKKESEGRKEILFTYGDDGEKFGLWPGTQRRVFEDGWLQKFFDELIKNKNKVELIHFSDYLKKRKPQGEVDIADGSYEEMTEWAGGAWKNFLSKYPEAQQMQRKMLRVSEKVEVITESDGKRIPKELEEAKKELYEGQCNCAYWHGLFGGVYLYHLRKAVFGHLIKSDATCDKIIHKGKRKWLEISEQYYKEGGGKEIVIEDASFSIYLDPNEGGVIKELDYRPASFNFINTLSRRKERYHEGMRKKLAYDRFPRNALRDYFLSDDITIERFMDSGFRDLGGFTNGAYVAELNKKEVILSRHGRVSGSKLKLSKRIKIISKNEIEILYSIEKKEGNLSAPFGVEFNLVMPDLNSSRYNFTADGKALGALTQKGSLEGAKSFGISDSNKELGVDMTFSTGPEEIWHFPVETVSQSDRGLELNYQCSSIFPRWHPEFKDGRVWEVSINFRIENG